MFRGAGKIGIRTINNPKTMYAPRANTFKITLESTQEEAKAFPFGTCGTRTIVDKITTEETWKLMLGIESFDPEDLSFLMNEQIATGNLTIPEVINTTIPSAAPFTVTNADLIVDQVVAATVLDSLQTSRYLTQMPNATATLAAGQFKVGAGVITFASAQAGLPVNYMYDKNLTNTRSIGSTTNPQAWGDVSFSGIVCGDRFTKPFRIFVPSMYATPKLDLSFGDKTTVEIEFTMKTLAGYRKPLLIADL